MSNALAQVQHPRSEEAHQSLTGTFNGNYLVEDDETGFLTAPKELIYNGNLKHGNGVGPLSIFDANKKLKVLNHLLNRWNISRACALVGVSKATFNNHYTVDDSFRFCVDEIRERLVDNTDEVRFNVAQTPSGSFDRMCLLNAYRRDIYNPKVEISVEHKISREEALAKSNRIANVIDAEVVETVRKIKKLKEKA